MARLALVGFRKWLAASEFSAQVWSACPFSNNKIVPMGAMVLIRGTSFDSGFKALDCSALLSRFLLVWVASVISCTRAWDSAWATVQVSPARELLCCATIVVRVSFVFHILFLSVRNSLSSLVVFSFSFAPLPKTQAWVMAKFIFEHIQLYSACIVRQPS